MMVSGTRINPMTEQFVKKFHKIMRDRGYKMTSNKNSALIEWQYEKKGSQSYCVWGWHGTGSYKGVKMVWGVMITPEGSWTPEEQSEFSVDHVENNSMSEESFKLYQQNLANIEKILKEAK